MEQTVSVVLRDFEILFAEEVAEKIAIEKSKEKQYLNDYRKIKERYVTGLKGEIAVLKLLGYNYKDIDSEAYKTPNKAVKDLSRIGYFNTEIKSVEQGKAHVIYKMNKTNQILCVVDNDTVDVLGIATIDILNKYQDDRLILDSRLRAKNWKTGFCGYEKLIPFNSNTLCKLEWAWYPFFFLIPPLFKN